jgi:ATP-binding protein involved in chromosome partitioning
MGVQKEDVLKALSNVMDPDLHQDLVTLGMIRKLEIEDKKIQFNLNLTTPACPLKEMLKNECIEAIHKHIGEDFAVEIDVTADVTSSGQNSLPDLKNIKNLIAVASGKGGVGKSTVTANLAVALAQMGAKVGLIDADIFGPSMPTMFNCEGEQPGISQVDGKNMIIPVEQYGVKLISIGFLSPAESAIVWRGPMASSALKQFITDTEWGDLDYLLFDLPPGTSDIHLTLVQTIPLTGAVVVTTPQKVAVADAIKGIAMFKQDQIKVPVLGLIENMAYFTPAELPENKYYIFGRAGGKDLAEKEKVPFIGEVPIVQDIREGGDNGNPIVLQDGPMADAFNQIAQELARQIAIQNASGNKTKVVEMKN